MGHSSLVEIRSWVAGDAISRMWLSGKSGYGKFRGGRMVGGWCWWEVARVVNLKGPSGRVNHRWLGR